MSNTFGTLFKVTTFGESHGKAIGGIIDGCPAGIELDTDLIRQCLYRRKPGQSPLTTSRKEGDEIEFLSGIFNSTTLGTPIGFVVFNENQHSSDYDALQNIYRPSHADYTYQAKYGIRDHRGGGRSSARETIARVAAGAIARQILESKGIFISTYTSKIENISTPSAARWYSQEEIDSSPVRCPDKETAAIMEQAILQAKGEGDSLGGIVTCVIKGVPPGIGEPIADKLSSRLAQAMMSINAAKGFEIGDGFSLSTRKGSQANDPFAVQDGKIITTSNHSGGIQGGISNGQEIVFKVAFKPTPTLLQNQSSVNQAMEQVLFKARGRHDPCVVPRAVPIVEAMTAITLLDLWLIRQAYLQG